VGGTSYRGHNVLLYFSEGAGCQSCITQMNTIESKASEFKAVDVTVLPIVMNSADEIRPELTSENVKTPFLIDADGNASRSYGVLGKGMHADLS
jgi:peroxiredoxin